MKKKTLLPALAMLIFSYAYAQPDVTYTSIEEALKTPDQVYKLDLYFQELTSLPDEVGQFVNLKVLELSGNSLTSLPETFGQLEKLEWLSLKGNDISKLPESFKNLTNLKELSLVYTNIKSSDQVNIKKMLPDCAILF